MIQLLSMRPKSLRFMEEGFNIENLDRDKYKSTTAYCIRFWGLDHAKTKKMEENHTVISRVVCISVR